MGGLNTKMAYPRNIGPGSYLGQSKNFLSKMQAKVLNANCPQCLVSTVNITKMKICIETVNILLHRPILKLTQPDVERATENYCSIYCFCMRCVEGKIAVGLAEKRLQVNCKAES